MVQTFITEVTLYNRRTCSMRFSCGRVLFGIFSEWIFSMNNTCVVYGKLYKTYYTQLCYVLYHGVWTVRYICVVIFTAVMIFLVTSALLIMGYILSPGILPEEWYIPRVKAYPEGKIRPRCEICLPTVCMMVHLSNARGIHVRWAIN
jgi:hypothetical protein